MDIVMEYLSPALTIGTAFHNTTAIAQPSCPSPCLVSTQEPTLMGIAKEIRAHILKLLLHNEDLGKPNSVNEDEEYGAKQTYGLTPAILVVCRQLCAEGIYVLYQQQEFYVACLTHLLCPLSPLTRYVEPTLTATMRELPPIKHVQHWIVVVSSYIQGHLYRLYAFMDFCRAICHLSPASLKVSVLLKGMEGDIDEAYDEEATIFAPLRLLRLKPGAITIKDADISEVPAIVSLFHSSPDWVTCFDETNDKERNTVIEIIEGDTWVEFGFEMHKALVKFCQSFERNHFFKKDMALWQGQYLSNEVLGDQHYLYYNYGNPYNHGDFIHPVEGGLRGAEIAAELDDNIPLFKTIREKIIMYLECQYVKICDASTAILEFIKQQKRYQGLLHANGDPEAVDERLIFTAKVLLDDYSHSFEREAPLDIKVLILLQQHHFKSLYNNTDRDIALRQFNTALQLEDYINALRCFRETVDLLDDQLIEIRSARKELFRWDLSPQENGGVELGYDSAALEHVVWDVVEPDLDVPFGENPDSDDDDFGDSDSDNNYFHNNDSDDGYSYNFEGDSGDGGDDGHGIGDSVDDGEESDVEEGEQNGEDLMVAYISDQDDEGNNAAEPQ